MDRSGRLQSAFGLRVAVLGPEIRIQLVFCLPAFYLQRPAWHRWKDSGWLVHRADSDHWQRITERVHLQFDANFTNVFNHPILGDPYNVLGDTADWGSLGSITGELITGAVQANAPRTIQLGLRLSF